MLPGRLSLALCAFVAASGCGDEVDDPLLPRVTPSDEYVGSGACRGCHEREFDAWHDSYHRTMTQVATLDNLAPPVEGLDGLTMIQAGHVYTLSVEDEALWVWFDDPDVEEGQTPDRVHRPVVMLTGSHHEQRFWTPNDDGTALDLLPLAYVIETGRWANHRDIFLSTSQLERGVRRDAWSSNCIRCHATGARPRTHLDPPDTEVAELGISCEACHGPGRVHVDAYARGIPPVDDPIVNPAGLSPERSVAVCGQCHGTFTSRDGAAWSREGPSFRPGDPLDVDRHVVTYHPAPSPDAPWLDAWFEDSPSRMDGKFWADGTVLPGGREHAGLTASACFVEGGLTCVDCHGGHAFASPDKMLRTDRLEDAACTARCHVELAATSALAAHSHHDVNSAGSRCASCHMPRTSWGMLRAVPSHRIDVPDIAGSQASGRPNACNLCHLDRSTRWAAATMHDWYGTAAPAPTDERDDMAAGVQWLLAGDAVQRGIAAWMMGWDPAREASGSQWMPAILAEALADPVSAVRQVASRSLRRDPAYADVGGDALSDTPQARSQARADVLARWSQVAAPTEGGVRVGLREDGTRDDARLDALIDARDDRPVAVGE